MKNVCEFALFMWALDLVGPPEDVERWGVTNKTKNKTKMKKAK